MADSLNTTNSEPSASSGLDDVPHESLILTSLAESGVDTLTLENLKALEGVLPKQEVLETMYGHGGPSSVASKLYEHDTSRPQSPGPQYPRQASNRQPRSGSSLMLRRISFITVAAVLIMVFFGLRLFRADAVCNSSFSLRTSTNLHSASTSSLPHGGLPIQCDYSSKCRLPASRDACSPRA